MRAIVHLSDLHFGRIHQPTLQPLIQTVATLKPDLVVVSGDLTQRARVAQFQQARAFLDALPYPQIVVPGNHDVPLYNLILRFFQPLSRFQRYITSDLSPVYIDEEIAVLGVNTSRSLVIKGGRINIEQVTDICEQVDRLPQQQTKIVVTHHPFDLPSGFDDTDLVGRSRMAMDKFAQCGVDLFLAGHLHLTHTGNTTRYEIKGYSALVIQAGTATSVRERGELNSFNLIRIDLPWISVATHTWQPDSRRFALSQTKRFRRLQEGWIDAYDEEADTAPG